MIPFQSILEPFAKLLSHTIQNCSFQLQQLLDICSLCGRAFNKVDILKADAVNKIKAFEFLT